MECMDAMTQEMALTRICGIAELFHRLCPGDWNLGQDVALSGAFWSFLHKHEDAPSAFEIADSIYFRWDVCLLADRLVDDYCLWRPGCKICVLWDRHEYSAAMRDGDAGCEVRYSSIWRALLDGGATIEPAQHQGPPFSRHLKYIAAAITETYPTEGEAMHGVGKYCEYVSRIWTFHLERVVGSRAVHRTGREWFRSIGRRLRSSLSPSKSPRALLAQLTHSEADNEGSGTTKLGNARCIFDPPE
ncbi:hypothetical protein B0H63DRAFT_172334 [Podospora didyma]|uniref:Uncharacterized protein n=1 Tax=Podospora didyma TaxID=330526 RepID=A0AAE0TZ58_9PEZI|nr:hypothetical protein B0H63DRAFT_172334 [Podospora didyma]